MNCRTCGVPNSVDAKFCLNCGAELHQAESHPNTKACSQCGFQNERDARFCANCGMDLKRHQHQTMGNHQHEQKPLKKKRADTKLTWHPAVIAFLIIGGIATFVALPYLTENSRGSKSQPPQVMEQRSTDPKTEAKVMEIASKFICSCGTCGEKSLDNCTCNRAAEERQFIRNNLQAGQTLDQVIAEVNFAFGWIKKEFASRYDSTVTLSANSKKAAFNVGAKTALVDLAVRAGSIPKPAAKDDRLEILSYFKCPCGQCGVDELKDCTCNHPRGATEVKAFVDRNIAEGKYTVLQIVDLVDSTYGSKKLK